MDAATPEELLKEFNIRATQHLMHGVPQMADRRVWRANPSINRKRSAFVSWENGEWDDECSDPFHDSMAFLAVEAHTCTVNIYSIQEEGEDNFCPKLRYVISPSNVRSHLGTVDPLDDNVYEIIKVAPYGKCCARQRSGLAVLYSPLRAPEDGQELTMKLICFFLRPDLGPEIEEIYIINYDKRDTVLAMGMNPNLGPIIVWHSWLTEHGSEGYRIATYRMSSGASDIIAHVEQNTSVAEDATEPVGDISIQGAIVNFHSSAIPLPHWVMRSPHTSYQLLQRHDTTLPDVLDPFRKHPMGRVLAHHHMHNVVDPELNDGDPTCFNTALELVISRDRPSPYGLVNRTGAFLLKAVQYPDACELWDWRADYRDLSHVFVAQLAGLPDIHNLPSVGLKLAVSPRSCRIAIASWRTVLVYAVEPKAFLDPVYSRSGMEGVPGDYAFIEGCGWQYYQNGDFQRECVVLEPVELPKKGVVFGLEWRDEDELWGWSDEGLVRWRIGAKAKGERGAVALDGASVGEEEEEEEGGKGMGEGEGSGGGGGDCTRAEVGRCWAGRG